MYDTLLDHDLEDEVVVVDGDVELEAKGLDDDIDDDDDGSRSICPTTPKTTRPRRWSSTTRRPTASRGPTIRCGCT